MIPRYSHLEARSALRNIHSKISAATTFSPDQIQGLLDAGTLVSAASGERLLERGEAGDSMFILIDGCVEIHLPNMVRVISEYGSYFGELAFIDPMHPRSATIVARTDARFYMLDQKSMAHLSSERPDILITLMRRTCTVMVSKEESLSMLLRQKNHELEGTLDYLRRTREELDQQELLAQTDPLTGLYNRRCFQAQIGRFMERSRETEEGLALIYLDLDHFKPINDQLGHSAGDAVLAGVGGILRSEVRRTDLPVRLGGDEFAIALLDVNPAQAQNRALHIQEAIRKLEHPGRAVGLSVTCSMGGTMYRTGEEGAGFVERADRALYHAKDTGRDTLCWR